MAESGFQEKTEAPTPKRREDARRRGQVARSAELSAAALLLGAGVLVEVGGSGLGAALAQMWGEGVRLAAGPPADLPGVAAWLRGVGWRVLRLLAPVLAVLAGTAVAVGGLQARGVLSAHPLRPELARLSPSGNLRRILGVRPLIELLKSHLKLGLVALVLAASLASAWPEIVALAQQSPRSLLEVVRRCTVRLLVLAGGAYGVLAVLDYLFRVWQHERSLRMSRSELRQELKETDGDLMVRARLRSMGRALARRRMYREVPGADVVVTNPTHVAVALRYDPARAPAPVVVAMGQRKIAERIKAIALACGVPVVENPPLARALYATGRIGLPIPAELYVAVAEVLAFVFRRRGGLRSSAGWSE